MRRKRFIILFVASFLLLDLFLAYTYTRNKTLETQQNTITTKYEKLRDEVSRIPTPENLTPGLDAGAIETTVSATKTQANLASQTTISFNCATRDFLFLPKHCSEVGNNTAAIQLKLNQYAQIMNSMEYLITFNPKFFALNYDQTSQVSQEKLAKLEDGLTKSQQSLESMIKSKERDDMLEIIKAVSSAKDRVAQTGDAQPLELLVEKIQEEIMKQVTQYYTSTVELVRKNAQEIVDSY